MPAWLASATTDEIEEYASRVHGIVVSACDCRCDDCCEAVDDVLHRTEPPRRCTRCNEWNWEDYRDPQGHCSDCRREVIREDPEWQRQRREAVRKAVAKYNLDPNDPEICPSCGMGGNWRKTESPWICGCGEAWTTQKNYEAIPRRERHVFEVGTWREELRYRKY